MRLPSLFLVIAAIAAPSTADAQDLAGLPPSPRNGVSQGTSVSVSTQTTPDGRLFAVVGSMIMELQQHSVRAPSFELREQLPSGELVREELFSVQLSQLALGSAVKQVPRSRNNRPRSGSGFPHDLPPFRSFFSFTFFWPFLARRFLGSHHHILLLNLLADGLYHRL